MHSGVIYIDVMIDVIQYGHHNDKGAGNVSTFSMTSILLSIHCIIPCFSINHTHTQLQLQQYFDKGQYEYMKVIQQHSIVVAIFFGLGQPKDKKLILIHPATHKYILLYDSLRNDFHSLFGPNWLYFDTFDQKERENKLKRTVNKDINNVDNNKHNNSTI